MIGAELPFPPGVADAAQELVWSAPPGPAASLLRQRRLEASAANLWGFLFAFASQGPPPARLSALSRYWTRLLLRGRPVSRKALLAGTLGIVY